MLDAGWVDEVDALARTVPASAPAWKSSGYATVRQLAGGEIDRHQAVTLIAAETRQYAKRQRTWFRHQLGGAPVTRVSPDEPRRDAIINAWWDGEDAV